MEKIFWIIYVFYGLIVFGIVFWLACRYLGRAKSLENAFSVLFGVALIALTFLLKHALRDTEFGRNSSSRVLEKVCFLLAFLILFSIFIVAYAIFILIKSLKRKQKGKKTKAKNSGLEMINKKLRRKKR